MKRTLIGALVALSLALLAAAVSLRDSDHAGVLKPRSLEFVVGDPRDTGPGTLRDAILAADRSPGHAHISLSVQRIAIESALPALINRHGIDIDAAPGMGTIDADGQPSGAVLQIDSPASTIRGLHIVNARGSGIVVNAPGVQVDSVTVTDSRIGLLLGAAARGCAIRSSVFERDETGVTGEADIQDVTILGSTFRGDTRAGVWLVGPPEKVLAVATAGGEIHERIRVIDSVFDGNSSGAVIGNRPVSLRRSRFTGNRESAVLVLGGAARVEDSEIRGSGAAAISVTAGDNVVLARNSLVDNAATGIMVRDSDILIERNALRHNGSGIVSIAGKRSLAPIIRDNIITRSAGDAITLIGGGALLQRNQISESQGAGFRALDLVAQGATLKAEPRLDANVIKGNGVDMPAPGVYRLAGVL